MVAIIEEGLREAVSDPTLQERHAMAVHTVIRAAVFNHLRMLGLCAERISREKLADAINDRPLVNGLTAMHDTVLRASMAAPDRLEGYLEQAGWLEHGRTQRAIAEQAPDQAVRTRLLEGARPRKACTMSR